MKRWEENIRKVIPYTPGEQPDQPDMIKLNTNENPYPPAPGVEKVLRELDADTLRLYPDPAAGAGERNRGFLPAGRKSRCL